MANLSTLITPLKILVLGSVQRLLDNIKSLFTRSGPPLSAAGLTVLCPIINGGSGQLSNAMRTRKHLHEMSQHNDSPMAKVPNTYLCRFYVLNDVFYEGSPATEEHLKSKYLVFSTDYYGRLNAYLEGMWEHAQSDVEDIWRHCVAFDKVQSAADFVSYMKKCQVKNHLFFNGSTGDPLAEQLKSLYLKQEFSRFVYENQDSDPVALRQAFKDFIARTEPNNLDASTWVSGAAKELVKS
ncbi:MAG: hypothetical protein U9P00_14030 [Pseudomonadota bacterium]|nr:hypothetical protein [Pseudomonadota bacterium]